MCRPFGTSLAESLKPGTRVPGYRNAVPSGLTAAESGIKVQNEKKWDVSGSYAGLDKNGNAFTAPFTVTLEIIGGKLNTNVAELKKRTYKDEGKEGP